MYNIYFLLYKRVYNDNKHFMIHENVYRLIRDDVQLKCLLSLYKKIYNDKKHFFIHESVYRVIRDNV